MHRGLYHGLWRKQELCIDSICITLILLILIAFIVYDWIAESSTAFIYVSSAEDLTAVAAFTLTDTFPAFMCNVVWCQRLIDEFGSSSSTSNRLSVSTSLDTSDYISSTNFTRRSNFYLNLSFLFSPTKSCSFPNCLNATSASFSTPSIPRHSSFSSERVSTFIF